MGGAWGKAQKATIISFEVHDYDDAAKVIKKGITIWGKKRHIELFKDAPPRSLQAQHQAQLSRSPVVMGQMKGYMYRPERHQQTPKAQSSRYMRCPTYRTGGKAYDVGKCPLQNSNNNNDNTTNFQGQKRSSNGAGLLAQRARTHV